MWMDTVDCDVNQLTIRQTEAFLFLAVASGWINRILSWLKIMIFNGYSYVFDPLSNLDGDGHWSSVIPTILLLQVLCETAHGNHGYGMYLPRVQDWRST